MADNNYLGIPEERKDAVKDFLELSADLDFWHDFHHGDKAKMDPMFFNEFATTFKITPNSKPTDKTEFIERVRRLQKELIKRQEKGKGALTFWNFFSKEASVSTILPSDNFYGRMGADEDKIIDDFLWVQHDEESSKSLASLKTRIQNKFKSEPELYKDKVKIRVGPQIVKHLGILSDNTHTPLNEYSITSFPNRHKGDKISPIIPLIEISDHGVQNFLLLIDVSLLKITDIKKQFRKEVVSKFSPEITYNVFIMSSLENESDPAGKINSIDQKISPADRADGVVEMFKNINVYFLTETEASYNANFPDWMDTDKNSLLYSKCHLRTHRTNDGKIACQVKLPNNKTVDHNDLGSISEIRAAGYAMTRKYIDYNLKPLPEQKSEISHYYLLKRAGDWCQALCLLDRDRVYNVKDDKLQQTEIVFANGEKFSKFSINDFLNKNPSTEISLMTHDRVLLSYALQMGLNVMFSVLFNLDDGEKTIAQIYFKNDKSKSKEFQYVLLLNQLNSILSKLEMDTYLLPDQNSSDYLKILKGMITEGASKINIDKINVDVEKSNSGSNSIKTKLIELKDIFETDLPKYLGKLRLLLFIGSHVETNIKLLEPIAPEQDIYLYISNISKTLGKIDNNKSFNILADNLDEAIANPDTDKYQIPIHFSEEYSSLLLLCKIVKERRDFINSYNTGVQRDWTNFEEGLLKQMEYDYKICQKFGIESSNFIPEKAEGMTYKGLKLFHSLFSYYFKLDAKVGGGSLDSYFTNILLSRKINTAPLNILQIPSDERGNRLLADIKMVYDGDNLLNKLVDMAKYTYILKSVSIAEPILSDYCNDFISYIYVENLVDKINGTEDLNNTIKKFDAEGLYQDTEKMYIERGTKLADISNYYNTVVDDYIIDSSNADGFRYIFNKLVDHDKKGTLFDMSEHNIQIFYGRFLIYYLDRLVEKISMYKVDVHDEESTMAYEDAGFKHLVKALYNINKLLQGDTDIRIIDIMTLYYIPQESVLDFPPPLTKDNSSNIYSLSLVDSDINSSIKSLELEIKRMQILCIFKYYEIQGYKNLNTQLLESLIYNLCNENKTTTIDILSIIIKKQIDVSTWNNKILNATLVVYLILSVYDDIDSIVDLNKLINIDESNAVILYTRAIRFASNNKWASTRLMALIEKAKKYTSDKTVVNRMEYDDRQNLLILWMYLNRSELIIANLLYKIEGLKIPALSIGSVFFEIVGNFIKICNILEPAIAKEQGYYINIKDAIILKAGDSSSIKISVDDFNFTINKFLVANNIPMRANFVSTVNGGVQNKRTTMKQRRRQMF